MKKIKYFAFVAVIASFILGSPTHATSHLSADKTEVSVRDSFNVSLSIDAAAAWNVHVSSTGPVENCALVDADVTADALDTKKDFTVNCTATGTGKITVSLSGDYMTADMTTTDLSDNLVVTVSENSEPEPDPEPEPEPEPEPDPEPEEELDDDIDENVPNTGASHNIFGMEISESGFFIFITAIILTMSVAIGLFIRRKIRSV